MGVVVLVAIGIGLAIAISANDQQRWDDFDRPPWERGIQVGETYEYSVNPHCGIKAARIDGMNWRADPPLDDGNGNPPVWWTGNTGVGELRIIDQDTAVFRNDDGHQAVFVRDDVPEVGCH